MTDGTPISDPLAPRDAAIAGFALDGTVKGVPPGARLSLADIASQGWRLPEMPLPLAVLRVDVLRRNARWMAEFAQRNGLSLCPHGKTTMAPQLWNLQLAEGAWGITVATAHQLQVARRFGVKRVIWANQPIGRIAVDAAFDALRDPDFDLFVLADSLAVVEGLAAGAARAGLSRPLNVLLEVGAMGGRTGARTVETALEVARAIAAAPGLALAGVEAFEGLLSETAQVDAFLGTLVATARACAAEGLFGTEEVLLTAGGTAFFDRIGPRLAAAGDLGRPVRRVLRSGCYLTHDSLGYEQAYRRMRKESIGLDYPPGDLRAALEVWAHVQSVPEPGRAIITCGKRDISADTGWPVPLRLLRDGDLAKAMPFGAFHKVTGMNDQHGYLIGPADGLLRVGDVVVLGVGHPCTTFDKWQVIPLVDEGFRIVGAIRTFF
ncbi:alanine racemase [Falsiroseomonas oryzae]|uniref:alanine racemase n=1 Tax=Falsiroseomonas oryzae TaxID=2766473 RepID=UPI0022EA8BE8|nr:alanine racemase [Roseomonas sp. MO-31]